MEGMERDCPLRRYEPLWGTWYVDGLLGRGSFGSVWQLRRETEGGTEYAALKEVLIAPSGGRMEGLDAAGEAVYFRAVLEETLAEAERMAGLAPCGAVVEFQACQAVELDGPGERGGRVLIRMERLVPVRELLEISATAEDVASDERQGRVKAMTKQEKAAEIARLEKAMKEAAKMLEFELAATLRDQIIELRGK